MTRLRKNRILISNESSRRLPTTRIRMAVDPLLQMCAQPPSEVSILFTSDEPIRVLNRDFRGIDEATDVLTFPGPGFPGTPLGDIAISVPFAERQAQHHGHPKDDELVLLALHGGLHLLGFDDETDEDRDEMVRRMNEVATQLGMEPKLAWSSVHEGDDR